MQTTNRKKWHIQVWFVNRFSLRIESCQGAIFFAGSIGGCHNDNLWIWHYEYPYFAVFHIVIDDTGLLPDT